MQLAKRQELKVRASWPLMVLHRVLSGDRVQYKEWKNRLDRIMQNYRLSRCRSEVMRRVVAHGPAWKRARGFGRLASFVVLGVGGWVSYGILAMNGWFTDFGLWPYALLSLPLIPAAMIAKRSLENAALSSMAATAGKTEASKSRSAALAGVIHSFRAGFIGGFALIFMQGLLSWIPNPAPTIAIELMWDAMLAAQVGLMTGAATAPLGLFLGQKPVDPAQLPPAPGTDYRLLPK